MPGTPTPILGLTVPTVNGDNNTWGAELNGDLAIIDTVGADGVFNINSTTVISAGTQASRTFRVTSGGLTLTLTIPDPGTIPIGKRFTFKLMDIGGQVKIVCVNPLVTIESQPQFLLSNQFAFVTLLANGASYDVVAQG
jgi:hypothetical protein